MFKHILIPVDGSETAQKAVIKGATESLLIDRVNRSHLADMLDALP